MVVWMQMCSCCSLRCQQEAAFLYSRPGASFSILCETPDTEHLLAPCRARSEAVWTI